MNNTIEVNHNGKEYVLDVEIAIQSGAMKPKYPLQPGDVYKATTHYSNPFLLVRIDYARDQYQLLGMGCSPNSNDFFCRGPHTLGEIGEYLERNGMVFHRNINKEIHNLVNAGVPSYQY